MKNKKIVLIITTLLLLSIISYSVYPILACKKLDTIVTGDAIYEKEDIERVSNLSDFKVDTIGSSMNPVMTENSQCLCIKKENYKVDDVIFFFAEINGQTMGITHRIIFIDDLIITKGDNNIYPDNPIKLEAIQCYIPKVMRWQTWYSQ